MAAGKGGNPSKEAKAAAKAARKQASKERRQPLWQAFQMQRKEDKLLLPLMIGAFVGVTVLFLAIGFIFGMQWFLLPIGLLLGALAAFIIFGRRVQKNVYAKAEGQYGAAAWVLDNLQGKWRVTPGVAATTQLDAVHRVVGLPGVILVAEGSPQRVKSLLAQEKKKVSASSATPRSTTSSSATRPTRSPSRTSSATSPSSPAISTPSAWTSSRAASRPSPPEAAPPSPRAPSPPAQKCEASNAASAAADPPRPTRSPRPRRGLHHFQPMTTRRVATPGGDLSGSASRSCHSADQGWGGKWRVAVMVR